MATLYAPQIGQNADIDTAAEVLTTDPVAYPNGYGTFYVGCPRLTIVG